MRKNLNSCRVEGYVYDRSKLVSRETGPTSKTPGTQYISGDLDIAVDEEGLNVVAVHFTYVTEHYASGKPNNTYNALVKVMEAENASWLEAGKENAMNVRVDGGLGVNDFIGRDGNMVAAKRCEGSFLNIVSTLNPKESERSTFQEDIVITKVNRIEANEERNIAEDYVVLRGAVFNFRNDLAPVDLVVRNPQGMNYFESLDVSASEPLYTKVWGHIVSQTIQITRTEESAFGDSAVRAFERKNREWVVTGTAKYPYDYGEEDVMTEEELKTAVQNREVHLAEVKKRNDEYLAKNTAPAATKAKTADMSIKKTKADFNF